MQMHVLHIRHDVRHDPSNFYPISWLLWHGMPILTSCIFQDIVHVQVQTLIFLLPVIPKLVYFSLQGSLYQSVISFLFEVGLIKPSLRQRRCPIENILCPVMYSANYFLGKARYCVALAIIWLHGSKNGNMSDMLFLFKESKTNDINYVFNISLRY